MPEEIRMTMTNDQLNSAGYYLYKPGGETLAESFVREVKNDLIDITKSFFKIGFRLHEADRMGYYRELGYSSIIELSEELFDFKKSTTYSLMQIWEYAHDQNSPMEMKRQYLKYSQSKLLELSKSGTDEYLTRYIAPSDSVKDIHAFITLLKAGKIKDLSMDSAKEYFKHYDRTSGLPLIPERTNEREEIEGIFQISGKSEPEQSQEAPQSQSDNERLIKKALMHGGSYGKFKIYDKYFELRPISNYAEFSGIVKQQYGNGGYCGDGLILDYSPKGFQVRKSFNEDYVQLTWRSVAYRIAELIESDEYLNDKEKTEYEKYKKQQEQTAAPADCSPVNTALDEEFFQISGKSELDELPEVEPEVSAPAIKTNRQYLESLSDEEFVEQFCTRVYIAGDMLSLKKIKSAQPKIIEWLKKPHKG